MNAFKKAIKSMAVVLIIFTLMFCMTGCSSPQKTIKEELYETIEFYYEDICGWQSENSMDLEDAETILWCYADENSGMDISEEELRKAIWVVLECNEEVRSLIYDVDDIIDDVYSEYYDS